MSSSAISYFWIPAPLPALLASRCERASWLLNAPYATPKAAVSFGREEKSPW